MDAQTPSVATQARHYTINSGGVLDYQAVIRDTVKAWRNVIFSTSGVQRLRVNHRAGLTVMRNAIV